MILAHKIALDPHDRQETYFRKAAGTAWLQNPTWHHPGDGQVGMAFLEKNAVQAAVQDKGRPQPSYDHLAIGQGDGKLGHRSLSTSTAPISSRTRNAAEHLPPVCSSVWL